MSTHEALVTTIPEIEKHPDPETVNLGIVKIWDYQVVVNKNQWKAGDLAIYIEPDTVVPLDKPEFSFLVRPEKPKASERIKVRRLRGAWSEGLLVPAPPGFTVGQDAWAHLGLERYVPPLKHGGGSGRPANNDADFGTGGGWEAGPEEAKLPFSKYDLENWKKYNYVFEDGEEVIITEKIHGSNAKYLWHGDRMYCGSRSGWRTNGSQKMDGWAPKDNLWWKALEQNPWIETICKSNPNLMLFGEVFGQVMDLKYGAGKNQVFFRVFDIFNLKTRSWMDNDMVHFQLRTEELVPTLYRGPYSKEIVLAHTDGDTTIPMEGKPHVREGCVVKPATEKIHPKFGRIALKNVSNAYLERA